MSKDKKPLPANIHVEEGVTCTVFIDGTDEVSDPIDPIKLMSAAIGEDISQHVGVVNYGLQEKQKNFEGSTQSKKELGQETIKTVNEVGLQGRIAPPPYEPESLERFLEVDAVHHQAVKTKVRDSVMRKYIIKSKYPINDPKDPNDQDTHGNTITKEQFQKDCEKIQNFLDNVNNCLEFEQICFRVGMDREAIGWGAFEVIRSIDGKVAKLNHIPATRLRVLEGWEGFVELIGFEDATDDEYFSTNKKRNPLYRYYQNFGDKVIKEIDNPFDFSENLKKMTRPYNPELDGDLEISEDIKWNFYSKHTGQKLDVSGGETMEDVANEILYLPNDHNATIYYGQADVVPAIGAILANVYIRDYLLQFFEHNCVPRYVVIIKGANVDDEFKKYITNYFKNEVKGKANQTMILTLCGMGNKNVEVEFKKVDADQKEADFLETRKSNDQIIMTAEGVSAALLAINDTASLGSGQGLSQAELYKNRIILPLQLFWAKKLNKLFKLGLGCKYAVLEFDPLDVRDAVHLAQVLNMGIQNGSWSINEARREQDKQDIEGGNVHYTRIREGSLVKVEDLPNINSNLNGKPLDSSQDTENNENMQTSQERNLETELKNSVE